jgi:TetR/AcrR family transcriptional regulator
MEKQRARSKSEKNLRVEKLGSSAKKLFSLHGYRGTTIEMITDDAGLSPAAFYLYYKNKLEVYRSLNRQGMDILESMITEALSASPVTASGKIRAIAGAYHRFFSEERELFDITAVLHLGNREFFSDFTMVPLLEKRTKTLLTLISSIIREGIKSGEFRRVDPWKTAVTLWGMMDGVLLLEVKKSTGFTRTNAADLADRMIDIVVAGLAAH